MHTVAIVAFQLATTVLVWFTANAAGRTVSGMGYTTLVDTRFSEDMGFNVFFRLLTPPVLLCLLALPVHALGLGWLTEGLWLVAVWYWLARLGYVLIRDWYAFMSVRFFWLPAIGSVALTWYFYEYAITKGVEGLLPDGRDAAFQLWLVVFGFAYAWLREGRDSRRDEDRMLAAMRNRLRRFRSQFSPVLRSDFSRDPVCCALLFTFMFMEDYNRPRMWRAIERVLARFGHARTTGIMQVTSPEPLTDEESVNRAQPIVAELVRQAIEDEWVDFWSVQLNEYEDDVPMPPLPPKPEMGECYSLWTFNTFVAENLGTLYSRYRGQELEDDDNRLREVYEIAIAMLVPRIDSLDGETDIEIHVATSVRRRK